MFSSFIEYLNRDDKRFISLIRDAKQRQDHLQHLRRARARYILFMVPIFLLMIFGISVESTNLVPIVLLIGFASAYLDAEMKVKLITLFEAERLASEST